MQALVDAALEAPLLEAIPEVDRPQILLRGRKRSLPLNNPCKDLHREDPESVQRFIACFRALPEDPAGRPVEIWLPAEVSHPEATTPREHYTRLIEHRAAQLLAGPRCER